MQNQLLRTRMLMQSKVSMHVETVCLLSREMSRQAKEHIEGVCVDAALDELSALGIKKVALVDIERIDT